MQGLDGTNPDCIDLTAASVECDIQMSCICNTAPALQGLADPAGRISNDAPGLQLAIALGASVYLLAEKKRVPRGEASLTTTLPCAPALQEARMPRREALPLSGAYPGGSIVLRAPTGKG